MCREYLERTRLTIGKIGREGRGGEEEGWEGGGGREGEGGREGTYGGGDA